MGSGQRLFGELISWCSRCFRGAGLAGLKWSGESRIDAA